MILLQCAEAQAVSNKDFVCLTQGNLRQEQDCDNTSYLEEYLYCNFASPCHCMCDEEPKDATSVSQVSFVVCKQFSNKRAIDGANVLMLTLEIAKT